MKKLIFNPFIRYAGGAALMIGLAGILFTAIISCFSRTSFDGIIDIHMTGTIDPAICFMEGLVNWACLVVIFYPMSLLLSGPKVRFIDIAGTMALSRLPMVIAALVGFGLGRNKTAEYILWKFLNLGKETTIGFFDVFSFAIYGLLLILVVIWVIALMYNAYAVSANLRGTKAVISFIGGLILAEIIAKVIYYVTGNFNPVFPM